MPASLRIMLSPLIHSFAPSQSPLAQSQSQASVAGSLFLRDDRCISQPHVAMTKYPVKLTYKRKGLFILQIRRFQPSWVNALLWASGESTGESTPGPVWDI